MTNRVCKCGKRIEGKGDARCYGCQEAHFVSLQERVRLAVNAPEAVAARAENQRIIRAQRAAWRKSA